MKVITEAKVRAEVPRSEQPEVYYIEPGYILSPAAREYLLRCNPRLITPNMWITIQALAILRSRYT